MLRLDRPRRVGGLTVAALCEHRAESVDWRGAGLLGFHGGKTPAAIVFADGEGVRAFDLRGRPLDPATLDEACPGLIRAMMAAHAAP